ncbi:hypothetical protein JCM10212_004937 [Sporobolomyces blumeae]
MSRLEPLAPNQDLGAAPPVRLTRATSHLKQEVLPSPQSADPRPVQEEQDDDELRGPPNQGECDERPGAATSSERPGQEGATRRPTSQDQRDEGTLATRSNDDDGDDGDNDMRDPEEEAEDDDDELEITYEREELPAMTDSEAEDDGAGDQNADGDESESDEAMDDSRSEGEIHQIEHEMAQLEDNVPEIVGKYRLVDRLGEGTFSSVYKAVDVQHSTYDNSLWAPIKTKGKVFVALKRIYVTSSPVRIHNELEILNDLRGSPNIAYLIDAIRHEDQVLAVMPYNRHQDFRTYYRKATLPMLRSYFSCLFRGLAATHKLQIIHRDVKPANFLFDITTGQGVLCDYGLAQKIGGDEFYEWRSECLHSLPGPSWGGLEGRRRSQARMESFPDRLPGLDAGLHGVRLQKPSSLWEQAQKQEEEYVRLERLMWEREDQGEEVPSEEWDELFDMKPWMVPPGWIDDIKGRMKDRQAFYRGWRPAKMGSSLVGHQRAGYLKEDRRPSVRANRAGTRGFRAPEVLLKCPDQTVALDVWSVGIILLCFLTRRFPFFNSNDDSEALAEIAAIFGKKKMERCAALHNRTFQTNVPDYDTPPHPTLHALVRALNPPILVENSPNPYGPIPSRPEEDEEWYEDSELCHAVDLMKRCLALDCTTRWTAEEALEHPFFKGTYDLGLGRTVERENGHEDS